tara:strand:- start:40 stop:309 length:270 start_codon:yes stop_codon:yes gene_type:complete
MSIKYKITRYDLHGNPPDEYIVGFALTNTTNNQNGYVESRVPIISGKNKTEAEICNIAFSGSYNEITGASGILVESATVIGAEFVPPNM